DSDVSSELALERRDFEAFDVDNVQLLAAACRKPDGFHRRVGRNRIAGVAERLLKEPGGAFDGERRQREMGKAHGAVNRRSLWPATSTNKTSSVSNRCW